MIKSVSSEEIGYQASSENVETYSIMVLIYEKYFIYDETQYKKVLRRKT